MTDEYTDLCHVKRCLTVCAKRKDADQSAHPRSLIRVFPIRIYNLLNSEKFQILRNGDASVCGSQG